MRNQSLESSAQLTLWTTKNPLICHCDLNGGGRGIRTPVPVARKAIFKTAALNHSAIPPLNILPVNPSARKLTV